ncbi:MAG: type II secretion system F family protein [Planctomycetes bacterium]|jgi:type IV pilus assembly protein PilC|nr:type II secretion system F family protein [Planctomycetota bacterium]HPY75521.1 type II secretion system F family protein [Planctomycetota bacterium]HQB01134.1 type II secretion system F family protein [Planctomycetota bacterium]
MAKYQYVAMDENGNEVKGTIEAKSREAVNGELRRKGMQAIDIQEKKSIFDMEIGGGGSVKVKAEDIVVFTRQMSTMISAGIPLLESLEILQDQQENKGFANALSDIVDRVRSGSDFSDSLGNHPKIFPQIYVSMVKAGEVSGQLDVILTRLAEYQEASIKLIRQIRSAMTYPVISLTMIFGITAFLMVFIIPQFEEIFLSLDVELPGLTKLILATSSFLVNNGLYVLACIIVFIIALKMYCKTPGGAYQADYVKLKLPIFGELFQKVAISRFSRTFATLIKSGVPLLGALEIVGNTSGNKLVEEAVEHAMQSVKEGESLAKPLSEFWVFPVMVYRMIAIGERSGALESLLEKISEFYDDQVAATVETLTSLIEPIMIGIMGALVGTIVLAVFLPIFKLQEQLAQ